MIWYLFDFFARVESLADRALRPTCHKFANATGPFGSLIIFTFCNLNCELLILDCGQNSYESDILFAKYVHNRFCKVLFEHSITHEKELLLKYDHFLFFQTKIYI